MSDENGEDIVVDVEDLGDIEDISSKAISGATTDPPQIKEKTAKLLGLSLVWIFGGTILSILVIFACFIFQDSCPEQVKEYTAALVSLLGGISDLSSAIFTPLLAFVLGYYFGTSKGAGGDNTDG